ncbi:MAG: phosphatidate cytidylyltransferase [Actinomycetales bacterium]
MTVTEPAAEGARRRTLGEARQTSSPAAAGTHPRRAGRNLPVAIGVGALLGAVVLVSLFVRREAFVVVAAVAVSGAMAELAAALRHQATSVPLKALVPGSAAIVVAGFVAGADGVLVAAVLTAGAVVALRMRGATAGFLRDVATSVFALVWVPVLASFAMLLLRPDDGARRVLVFILLVVCNDVGGYTAGVLFGRHPLAPAISPKKSWEGAAGSLVFACVGGSLAVPLALQGPWLAGLVLGIATVVSATFGDLAESMVKRDLGIKDMGHLLPGHGGLMDRLDSLLPSAPVAFAILAVFVA